MFSLPNLIKKPSGEARFKNGILVSLPVELCDAYRRERYSAIKDAGWGTSEFSYSYYAFRIPFGDLVIFPGLYIIDQTKPTKRFHGYGASLTRAQVEQLASEFVSHMDRAIESVQGDLAMLVHDLRALSNAIYNPAVDAQRHLNGGEILEAKKRIETVIAAQGILRMRTDALDFSGNAIDPDDASLIPIFRKIDKVQRCFKSLAVSQNKSVSLSGLSYRKAMGQDVFELIPYTIIDNAVKYSPEGYDISVHVQDDINSTVLRVKSFGPKIEDLEKLSIFDRYVRGQAAVDTKSPGSGIGLNIAAKIVDEVFGGNIEVCQKNEKNIIDGLEYFETNFIVTVPSVL